MHRGFGGGGEIKNTNRRQGKERAAAAVAATNGQINESVDTVNDRFLETRRRENAEPIVE